MHTGSLLKMPSGLTSAERGVQQDWERLPWVAGVTKASADPTTGSSGAGIWGRYDLGEAGLFSLG